MFKVGWLCPCIGVGGGDGYMSSIIQHSTQLEHIGIYVQDPISKERLKWFKQLCQKDLKIVQIEAQFDDHYKVKEGVTYYGGGRHEECFRHFADECDIIISWCFKNLGFFCRSIDKPVIEIIQNSDEYAKEIALENRKTVDYRVAVSQSVKNIFDQDDFIDRVIYNAVEPNRLTPRYGEDFCRKSFGLQNNKIILFMGRLVDEKFPEALVHALLHLPEEWVGVYVGTGYKDQQIVEQIESLVPGRVLIMEPQYYIGDLLAMANVFMLCSDFEGHPLSVCEAWLAGVPVVTTNIPVMEELRDIYGDLATYLPLRPAPELLAEAVLRADSGSGDVNQEIHRARYVAWSDFTSPRAAVVWEEFINDCVHDWNKKSMRYRAAKIMNAKPRTTCKTEIVKVAAM